MSEENANKKYVVVRDNYRVSENEYSSPDDPAAIEEQSFWSKIAKRNLDNTKVKIVEKPIQ